MEFPNEKCCELNCGKNAEWIIWDGIEPAYDHKTYACSAHIAELYNETGLPNQFYPIEWDF